MPLSTMVFNQTSEDGKKAILDLGFKSMPWITEHLYVEPDYHEQMKALPKAKRYKVIPYSPFLLAQAIELAEAHPIEPFDIAGCVNREEEQIWMEWCATTDDARRVALDEITMFTRLIKTFSVGPIKWGLWGTPKCDRSGNFRPHPWRNAGAMYGDSVHPSAYYHRADKKELGYAIANVANAMTLTEGPVRAWVCPEGTRDNHRLSTSWLSELAERLRDEFYDPQNPDRFGICMWSNWRWSHKGIPIPEVDKHFTKAATAIAEGWGD